MKLYRVILHNDMNSSRGYLWHSNMRDAKRALKTFIRENTADHYNMWDRVAEPNFHPLDFSQSGIEEVEIKTTKLGILKCLDEYAGHPNNG